MDLYNQLSAEIKKRPSKKLAGSTYLTREGDQLVVTLYETKIVRVNPDSSRQFWNGGWATPTTKKRIEEFGLKDTFWRITSAGGVWQLIDCSPTANPDFKLRDRTVWVEGVGIDATGKLVGGGPPIGVVEAQRKLIRNYSKRYMAAWIAGKVERPSGGDPWNFSMAATDGTLPLQSDTQAYLTNLAKGEYYYGSLLLRAMEFALGVKHGDQETLIGVLSGQQAAPKIHVPLSRMDYHMFGTWWTRGLPEDSLRMGPRRIGAVLSTYLLHFFGLPAARS